MGLYSDKIFPYFYDCVVKHKHFDSLRAQVLDRVKGKVLEIGVGTGLNLDHYPDRVSSISAIEPNPGMKDQLLKKANTHRIDVEFHQCGAEAMPFEDGSFDTVVSTITLCSIPELERALVEIKRVLKPGGQFLFLDHGLSNDSRVITQQKILNPLQKLVGVGCQLIIPIGQKVEEAGFDKVEFKQYHVENAPKFVGSVYEGVGLKGLDH